MREVYTLKLYGEDITQKVRYAEVLPPTQNLLIQEKITQIPDHEVKLEYWNGDVETVPSRFVEWSVTMVED